MRTLDEWKEIVLEALELNKDQTRNKALAEQIKEDLALAGVDDVSVELDFHPAADRTSIRVKGMVTNLDRHEHRFSALLDDTPIRISWSS